MNLIIFLSFLIIYKLQNFNCRIITILRNSIETKYNLLLLLISDTFKKLSELVLTFQLYVCEPLSSHFLSLSPAALVLTIILFLPFFIN